MPDSIGTLVILGAGGDLTWKLLLPGVGQLLARGGRLAEFELIGVGRSAMTNEEWQERVAAVFEADGAVSARGISVAKSSRYVQADVTIADDLARVLAACSGVPVLYFALPPHITIAVCTALAEVDLPDGIVLALEKPFGTDRSSAVALNRQLARLVPARQVFRVDHFLGTSTVLNLLGLRFANRVFERVWNRDDIAKVEIIFDETLALEGRAGYYDSSGALIDMIQSHLLLILALVTMEPPSKIDEHDLAGAMAQALRATSARDGESRHARYTSGSIDGREVPNYVDEPGVDPTRGTETLAEITFGVDNWRWAGVPFVLRSGKALGETRQEIVVTFAEVPHLPGGLRGCEEPTRLRISLSPEEIALDLSINGAGNPFDLDLITLAATFGAGDLGPYGEVLSGILSGDSTLSVRADVAEECWRIVEPVLEAWSSGAVPLEEYPAGSDGAADPAGQGEA